MTLPPTRRRALWLGGALVLLVALWPAVDLYAAWRQGGYGPAAAIAEICAHCGPPPTQTGQGRPAYGAFVRWSLGHEVLYRCGEAAVANPWGNAEGRRGIDRFARLAVAGEEELDQVLPAGAELKRWFVEPLATTIDWYAALAGQPPERFVLPGPAADLESRLQPGYFATVVSRLAHFDGSRTRFRGEVYPGLGTFRLLREAGPDLAPGPGSGLKVKLYERVPGVRITGPTTPGSTVRVKAEIQLPTGRRFRYLREVSVPATGVFELRLPYPTEPTADGGYAREPYLLLADGVTLRVRVSQGAVEGGQTLELGSRPLPAPAD